MSDPGHSGFQTGDDFISFDRSPSPPTPTRSNGVNTPSVAGPSTSRNRSNDTLQNGKGKYRDPSVDDDSRAARPIPTGPKIQKNIIDDTASSGRNGNGNGKGKSKDENRKGKSKRSRDDDDLDDGIEYRNLKEERMARERQAPWADLVDWKRCRDPAEMLNEEIIAFYDYISPSRKEYETRSFIIQLITKAVQKVWPEAEVTPFGSWQTQLYLPRGDIDLVVTTKRYTDHHKNKMLAELARAMRQAYITDVVAIISKAKVPIIKFVTSEGKLNVDISINQTNGVSAGNIINQYLDVLPGSRQLVLVVKAFLSQRSMNEVYTGGLGSYSVICMVISFLQVHPKLRNSELDPLENLGTLLLEFFELYGRNFNYDEVGITIRRGGGYFSKRRRGWIWNNQNFLLSIEDPQDRDNDIAKSSFGIRQVKATLAGAYEVLQRGLFERAEWLSGRRSGRYDGDFDGEKLSILSGVMGVTKETLKHRREIKALHEEGRLQRLLGIPVTREPSPEYRARSQRHDRNPSFNPSHASTPNSVPSSPPPLDGRNGRNDGFQAILVDDSEDEGSDEEYKFDSEDEEEDDNGEDYDLSGIISDPEEGEIEEVFPVTSTEGSRRLLNGGEGLRGRFGSVEEDHEIDRVNSPNTDEPEEIEESRYALKPSLKSRSVAKNLTGDNGKDDDDDTASVSSIEIIEPPVRPASPVMGNKSKLGRSARRAFWAAKGGAALDSGVDDFDGKADFVELG